MLFPNWNHKDPMLERFPCRLFRPRRVISRKDSQTIAQNWGHLGHTGTRHLTIYRKTESLYLDSFRRAADQILIGCSFRHGRRSRPSRKS